MTFWPGYERHVRSAGRELRMWIRRAHCGACETSPALLPGFLLPWRVDDVTTIGTALVRGIVDGVGQRKVAAELGLPHTTVRGWRRRHRERAPGLAAGFAAWLVQMRGRAPVLRDAPERNAMAALAALWERARGVYGVGVGEPWHLASAVTGGEWLGTTTTSPWAGLALSGLMRSRTSTDTRGRDP